MYPLVSSSNNPLNLPRWLLTPQINFVMPNFKVSQCSGLDPSRAAEWGLAIYLDTAFPSHLSSSLQPSCLTLTSISSPEFVELGKECQVEGHGCFKDSQDSVDRGCDWKVLFTNNGSLCYWIPFQDNHISWPGKTDFYWSKFGFCWWQKVKK